MTPKIVLHRGSAGIHIGLLHGNSKVLLVPGLTALLRIPLDGFVYITARV